MCMCMCTCIGQYRLQSYVSGCTATLYMDMERPHRAARLQAVVRESLSALRVLSRSVAVLVAVRMQAAHHLPFEPR